MKKITVIIAVILSALTLTAPVCADAGVNICENAKLVASSGGVNDEERARYLVDGDIDTKWCVTDDTATPSDTLDEIHNLGYRHFAEFDLGSEKYFDSYTMYQASEGERDYGITEYDCVAWTLQISSDGESWETVSDMTENYESVSEVYVGRRCARYIRLLISQGNVYDETVRIPELMLFECAAGATVKSVVYGYNSDAVQEEMATLGGTDAEADDEAEVEIDGYVLGDTADIEETGTVLTAAHIVGGIVTAAAAAAISAFAAVRAYKTNAAADKSGTVVK